MITICARNVFGINNLCHFLTVDDFTSGLIVALSADSKIDISQISSCDAAAKQLLTVIVMTFVF